MFTARWGLWLATGCVVLVGLMRPLGAALAGGGLITFEDTGSNNQSQLFAMDLRRGLTATLTDGRIPNASRPTWSPDGNHLAFVSVEEPYISTAGNVFVIEMSINVVRRVSLQELASWQTFIDTLAWSPDGTQLAVVGLIGGMWGLFLADVQTGDLLPVSDMAGAQVVWSPDGSRIALNAFGDNRGLHVVNAECVRLPDGCSGALRLLTEGPAWMGSQAWSPDGSGIVFSNVHGIHVVTIDGANITRQIIHPSGYLPAWSPDGARIAFVESDIHADLYTMQPDGSDAQRLLLGGNDWYVYDLAWSPDGRRLALESECVMGGDEFVMDLCLYVVNSDGSDARRIPIQVDPQFAGRFVWWP